MMNFSRPVQSLTLGGLALGSVMLCSASAFATNTGAFLTTIPNGNVAQCVTCHTDMIGPLLNPFGEDVKVTLHGVAVDAGAKPVWSEICAKDSDGDGQTNGQELGDPCCTWQEGQTPPRTSPATISNPGLPASKSSDPSTPACATPTPPDTSGDDSGGGCSLYGRAAGLSASALALLFLALAGPARRRRTR